MASPPFLLPFAHWDPSTSFLPPCSSITAATFTPQCLALGLSCGEILLLTTTADSSATLAPHARLSGSKAAVVALRTLEAQTEAGRERRLLSLDEDGRVCKWSLSDGRCLQSVSGVVNSRPRGLRVAGGGEVVVVYACSTEIVVLSAETLEMVVLWTGNVDWPLVAVAEGGREVLVLVSGGGVHGWVLGGGSAGGMGGGGVEKDYKRQFTIEPKEGCGEVVGFERCADADYVVVQRRGARFYAAENQSFVLRKTIDVEDGGREIAGYEVFERRGVVFLWTAEGQVRIIGRGETGLWGVIGTLERPGSMGEGARVVAMAFTERKGSWVATVFTQSKCDTRKDAAAHRGLAVGVFSLKGGGRDIAWKDNHKVLSTPSPTAAETPLSSASALFSNMIVFAHGPTLHFHTFSTFLLSYASPTSLVPLPTTAQISLLKRVRIGEYIGSGRNAGIHGGKEYLIAGTSMGTLHILTPPTFTPSPRLPISAAPITSANLLPITLGKRLRSTLFVTATDGTAAVVDVERARVMVTFPTHDYFHLVSFATRTAANVLLLTYEDGTKREWDLGEDEGGVLKLPPSPTDAETWREVRVGTFELEPEDREEEGESPPGDGTMKACEAFCEEGLPTTLINVRAILDALKAAVNVARERTRPRERVVVGNHPALITAKSLLTALVPNGMGELFGWDNDDDHDEDEGEWRSTVDRYFFRRKLPAVLGQVGAAGHVSLLAPEAVGADVWGVGGTVTSIVLLAALAIVGGLLEASGKEREVLDVVVGRALAKQVGVVPALGVWAKYWMDGNPLIRRTARRCMHVCMERMSEEERARVVEYWERFLPVVVPPELFSSKEVVRSVVVLGKLVSGWPDLVDASVRKNVALSVELLLGDSNPHFQDTAIELVGYGWPTFQSLFDPAEVIHILIRISSAHPDTFPETRRKTLHKTILRIATHNSPLLCSSLSNNIAHGTPTPTAPSATTTSSATPICIAAMRLATTIIQTDPLLFNDILPQLIASIVKILDPSSPLRERVLPTITELINELIEAYPTLTFHRPTQRLALSLSPGTILVYDLKAACEQHVLQGHRGVATFLSFYIDGRYLVAVDMEEGALYVWRFVSGILSFIGGSEGPAVLQPRRREVFSNSRGMGVVEVEWTGERSVKVTAGEEVTVVQNVDGGKGEGGWGIL